MRKFSCAVDSEVNSVDIAIFNDGADEVRELIWLPWSAHGSVSVESIYDLLAHAGSNRSGKDSWGYSRYSDSISSEVSGHWHDNSINGSFGRRVSNLPSLSLFSSHARHKDNDSFFSSFINWLVLGHQY